MSKKLVIVESPAKSKTIAQYLGEDYQVYSSIGHIRDLAITGPGGLGVDVKNNFKPKYIVLPDKKKVIHNLNKALKESDELFLATDPDREGEAISWHLSETLNIKDQKVHRVVFNEITRDAIQKAFSSPGEINRDLVNSQETRRILDRIIGFKLSNLLQSKIKSKSAGRVQSAVLKLIVDREKEIEEFNIEEYYEIYALFKEHEAKLIEINNKKPKISTQKEAEEIINSLDELYKVESITSKVNTINPKPAFITSTLQRLASTKYGFSPTKTMSLAQSLYEGKDIGNETVGLITYMRTDSTRLSGSFISEVKEYVTNEFGTKYFGNFRKSKQNKNVQDAHEAIRPTSIYRTPKMIKKYLTAQEYKIYSLIYVRAMASLMKAKKTETTSMFLKNGNTKFKISSTKELFDGYLKIYKLYESIDKEIFLDLSKYKEGNSLKAKEVFYKQLFTTPPARYTESSLIKKMEDLGIGRPSTYAQTIQTIKKRKYVEYKEKKFYPTEQGKLTIKKLDEFFHEFIGPNYSKNMEVLLDKIAVGEDQRDRVLKDFYDYFMPLINNAVKNMTKIKPKETGELCPVCGSPMVYRQGRYGEFEACSNYPKCKYIKPNDNKPKTEVFDTLVKCPECEGATLVVRVAKKGKNKGKKFLAASTFPKCKYISPLKVTDEFCPKCGNVVVENEKHEIYCINPDCDYHK